MLVGSPSPEFQLDRVVSRIGCTLEHLHATDSITAVAARYALLILAGGMAPEDLRAFCAEARAANPALAVVVLVGASPRTAVLAAGPDEVLMAVSPDVNEWRLRRLFQARQFVSDAPLPSDSRDEGVAANVHFAAEEATNSVARPLVGLRTASGRAEFYVDGTAVRLGRNELTLVQLLSDDFGAWVRHDSIELAIWPRESGDVPNRRRNLIHRTNKKLMEAASARRVIPSHIIATRVGYVRIDPDACVNEHEI